MSIENFLDHRCDIYHIVKAETSVGYGLPDTPTFTYNEVPDLVDVPCHFKDFVGGTSFFQNAPNNKVSGDIILKIGIGTDIRHNDRVIDKSNGLKYKAHIPRSIRTNHIKVKLQLEEDL